MESSDDEDVLMKNSPLYDYLKETCPEDDFLTCQTASTHEQLQDADTKVNQGASTKESNGKGSVTPGGWLARLRDYKQHDALILAQKYLPQYMCVLLGSQSMFEEDIQIVMMYSDAETPTQSKYGNLVKQDPGGNGQTFSQVLSTFGLFATLVGLCVGGYRAMASDNDITTFQVFTWCTLIGLCLANAVLYGSTWWRNSLLQKQHKINVKLLERLVGLHDKYGSLLRKCIRYVQEIEVISRGFTLATPFTPAAHLDSIDSLLAQQQCPLLREVCFQTCKHQIAALKQATMSLLKSTRLQPEVDGGTSYLAKMDLDKIIPQLSAKSENYDDELDVEPSPVTRSLAVLKVMYDLYIELKSEFLRRLMLCLCPDAIQVNWTLDANTLQMCHHILSEILGTSQKMLSKLDHSYEWHKERPTSRRREGGQGDQSNPLQVRWSPAKHLVTTVHSLRLHLDVALNGVITAEDHIANFPDDISNQDQMEKIYKILETLLEGANEKLQSSHSCLQQASMALAKLQGKEQKKKCTEASKPADTIKADPSAELPMTTLVMPLAPEDMDFEDLVYEADMANEEHNTADQSPDSEWLTEEKERRKQEAEETKHLLHELHTVLGQRSKEREQRKLSRNGQAIPTVQVSLDRAPDAGGDLKEVAETIDSDGIEKPAGIVTEGIQVQSELEADAMSEEPGSANYETVSRLQTGAEIQASKEATSEDFKTLDTADDEAVADEMKNPMPSQPFGLPGHAIGFPFMSSVAAEAVRKSKQYCALTEETFGQDDESSSEEEG